MTKRFLASTLATVLVATSFPGPAWAQATKPTSTVGKTRAIRDELPAEAKAKWDSALMLFRANNWDGALADFQQAHTLSNNPRVLFNVAVCQKNLNRYTDAIETLQKELADGMGKLPADEQAQVEGAIKGLGQYVTTLALTVSEPGAKVMVDGREVGTTPLPGPLRVQAGERKITIQKAGFLETTKPVIVSGGVPASMEIKLEASTRTGMIEVTISGAPTATIRVDGREVGQTDGGKPFRGNVPVTVEPHVVEAFAPGYMMASQPVHVAEGKLATINLTLSREQEQGKLLVTTVPPNASILIDGKVMGATHWEGPVGAGTHQVVVKKDGYYSWSFDVEVPRGGERNVTANLNEQKSTSWLVWALGGTVVIGGVVAATALLAAPPGAAPVNGSLRTPVGAPVPAGIRF